MKPNPNDTKRWQEAFGAAPDAYVDDMRHTLAHVEEAEPMKKRTIQTVVLAFALVLLLASVGLAVAHNQGLLDFIGRNNTLPENIEEMLQKDIDQQGGALPGITATVREAVTDGVQLYVLVEYAANDPDDVILVGSDSDPDADTWPLNSRSPYWADIRPEQRRIVLGGVAYSEELYAISAYDWSYLDTGSVLVTYQTQLDSLENIDELIRLTLQPVVFEQAADGGWAELGRGEISMAIRRTTLPIRRIEAETPLDLGHGYTLVSLEITSTELATYLSYHYTCPTDDNGEVIADNLYLEIAEANGDPLKTLRDLDAELWKMDPSIMSSAYIGRVTSGAAGSLPDNIMIRAKDYDTDAVVWETIIPLHSHES